MEITEVWKDIPEYEGLYQVSNLGNIRSLTRYKAILKTCIDKDGYKTVWLRDNGRDKFGRVCRIVAEAFVPNPENKPQVNHIDFNRKNDSASNLEWLTIKENIQHSVKNGRYKGINSIRIKQIIDGDVVKIWNSLTDASKELGIPISNISRCAHGRRRSAGGYGWKYV